MSAEPMIIKKDRVGERMFAHRDGLFKGHSMLVCLIASLSLLIAGCGDDSSSTATAVDESSTGSTTEEELDLGDADPEDLQVIQDWSSALADGDVEGAAEYFATPSTAENGSLVIQIEDTADAVAFNESLPCGAEVISARTEGEFTSATFRLSERPGSPGCVGVGGTASTSFVIDDGKIVEWRRIDEVPDDAGGGNGVGGAAV